MSLISSLRVYSFSSLIYIWFFTLWILEHIWYGVSENVIFMAEHLNTVHLTQEFSAVTCQLIHYLNIDRKWRFLHPGVLYGRVQPIWNDEISYQLIMVTVPIIIIGLAQGQIVRVCGCIGLLPGVIVCGFCWKGKGKASLHKHSYLKVKITSDNQHFSIFSTVLIFYYGESTGRVRWWGNNCEVSWAVWTYPATTPDMMV